MQVQVSIYLQCKSTKAGNNEVTERCGPKCVNIETETKLSRQASNRSTLEQTQCKEI